MSILDAPDLLAASVAFRIDRDARPATRCWPVDPAERRLPQVLQDTLRTVEPYVFSLADIGTERTAGVTCVNAGQPSQVFIGKSGTGADCSPGERKRTGMILP